jgi:gamma-tubulin complex component 3
LLTRFRPPNLVAMEMDTESNNIYRLVHGILGHDDQQAVAVAQRIANSHFARGGLASNQPLSPQADATHRQLHHQIENLGEDGLADGLAHVLGNLKNKKSKPHQQQQQQPSDHRSQQQTSSLNSDNMSEVENVFLSNIAREEDAILRECLYALQGISGERIKFYDDKVYVKSPAVDLIAVPTSKLGSGARDALSYCLEAGWLYSRIREYISKALSSTAAVSRALAVALEHELQSYQSFLTQLDNTSLRQLVVSLAAPLARLQTLTAATDRLGHVTTSHDTLTALHQQLASGDTRQESVIRLLLEAASRPWLQHVYQWTTEGKVTTDDFCITAHSIKNDCDLWRSGYHLDTTKLPPILDAHVIETAFLVGKGINYIRRCLGQEDWVLDLQQSSKEPVTRLRETIELAARQVHPHILQSLMQDHALMEHLFALKQFLLLGQGDFYSALCDALHTEFGNTKENMQYHRQSLIAITEVAIKRSNANDSPSFVLDRLQVNLRPAEDMDKKQTVWETFS